MRIIVIVILSLTMPVIVNAQIASPFGPAAAWLVEEGDSLLRINKPQKAIEKYTQAIDLEPSATNYAARARAWYKLDRMDRVLLDSEQALKLDSTHGEANYQRARYAFRADDHRLADRLTTRALDRGPKDKVRDKLLVLRGEARAELKRPQEAIADLTAGLGARTDNLLAFVTRLRDEPALPSACRARARDRLPGARLRVAEDAGPPARRRWRPCRQPRGAGEAVYRGTGRHRELDQPGL